MVPPERPSPAPPLRLSPVLVGRLRAGLPWFLAALPLCLLLLWALIRARPDSQAFVLPLWMGALALAAVRGAAALREVDTALDDDRARGRRARQLGFCLCYFAPFVHWFLAKPGLYYLAINVFLLFFCTAWWLVLLMEGMGALAGACGAANVRRDAMVCARGSLILHTFLQIFLVGQVAWHHREIGGGRFPHLFIEQWKAVFLVPFALAWLTVFRAWRTLPEWELEENGGV